MNYSDSECEEYRDLLGGWISGGISPADELRLREHLFSCPQCAALAGTFRSASDVFGNGGGALDLPGGPRENAPPRFREKSAPRAGRSGGPAKQGAVAAIICIVIVIVAVPLYLRFGGAAAAHPAPPAASAAPSTDVVQPGDLPSYDDGAATAQPLTPAQNPEYMAEYFVIITIDGDLPDFLSGYTQEDLGGGNFGIVVPRGEIAPLVDAGYDLVAGNEQAQDALIIYTP